MKKIFSTVILLLFFSFKSFAAPDGRGEVKLSEDIVKSFRDYIVVDTGTQKSLFNKPGTFWITIDGSRSYWFYIPQEVDQIIVVLKHIRISFRPMKLSQQVTEGLQPPVSLQKKEPNVKDIMVRVAADLLKVDMLVGIIELTQKEKRLNLVAK